jgi:hypothetical protein
MIDHKASRSALRGLWCGLFLLCAVAGPSANAAPRIELARDGNARAVIIVAKNAPAPDRHAAAELALYLKKITGATFAVADRPRDDIANLLVGVDAARAADAAFTLDGDKTANVAPLGKDGLLLRAHAGGLILAGRAPRGTLYAVYTFLEDHLGCHWWTPWAEHVPRNATLSVPALDVRHTPPFEYREPFWTDAHEADWAARNKSNGNSVRADKTRGGKHTYVGFVHTFYQVIKPSEHFEKHPEWFSLIKGKRVHKRAQLCLTNASMRIEYVRRLKANLVARPEGTIASVSQNDWHGNCQCGPCAALDTREGGPAGSMLHFVNAVAEAIEKDFPDVAVSTLAYQYTRKPPRHVRPRPNVIVRLCSIECSFSRPLTHASNRAFHDDLKGWAKICNRLYIWDYVTNFRHHILPHPNVSVLGPNIRLFAASSVRGVFEQGAYTTAGAEMAELRAWVLAQLLWDPTRDAKALVQTFLRGYFGDAAPHLSRYLDRAHRAVLASGDKLGCFSPHTARFLTFDFLNGAWADLQAAERAVADQSTLRERVQAAQLPLRYAFLMRWNEYRAAAKKAGVAWPLAESPQAVFDEFIRVARKRGVTRLNEWNKGFGTLEAAVNKAK